MSQWRTPRKVKDGWLFATVDGPLVLTEAELDECRIWMNESNVDERDHMRYLRDTAARYGNPLIYLQRWGEYYRLKSVQGNDRSQR